jgi:hypothetical protein
MYGAAGERRSIFVQSDAFVYNLGDPTRRMLDGFTVNRTMYERVNV